LRLVLLGAPASGKGTQGDILGQRLGIPKISTGDMLRAARQAGTPLGQEADRYMSDGKLVPDGVVIGLVAERITESDAVKGFILDGFPRTVPQAEALGAMLADKGLKLDHVVEIGVPRELLTERATLRRTDKRTGQIYHLKYSPPPPDAELEHRADDQEATVLKRLNEYDALTAALTPYYDKLGLLRRVDGVGKPEQVTQRIMSVLGKDQ
jgi:adenylate kinase